MYVSVLPKFKLVFIGLAGTDIFSGSGPPLHPYPMAQADHASEYWYFPEACSLRICAPDPPPRLQWLGHEPGH